jgi:alkylation response protein AidB-like acyl-CoA dehydrogenase
MLVRVEEARCALWYACAALDGQGPEDPALLVPAAVLLGTRAAEANARDCIQVHGGIGFTWELPAHLYLKRARTLSCSVGPRAALAEAVAAAL